MSRTKEMIFKLLRFLPLSLLYGCTLPPDPFEKPRWETKIHQESSPLTLSFSPKQSHLSLSAQKRIRETIKVPGETSCRLFIKNTPHSLDNQRVQKTIAYLLDLGIQRDHIDLFIQQGSDKESLNTLSLIIDHTQVIKPKCPGWTQEMNGFISTGGEVNFGCATEYNLAAMVSNPSVVHTGRKLGETDANRLGKAIDNYRTDAIKKIQIEKLDSNKGSS